MSRPRPIRTLAACALLLVGASAGAAPMAHAAEGTEAPQQACTPLAERDAAIATSSRPRDPEDVQLDGRLIVSPASVEVDGTVDTGSSLACRITLRNRHPRASVLELDVRGLRGARTAGTGLEYLDPGDRGFDDTAGPWVSVLQDGPFTIPSRGVVDVTVVVDVPAEVPDGARYAALFISPVEAARVEGATSVGIVTSIAVPFLIDVTGAGAPRLRLRGVEAPRLRWNRASWTLRGDLDNVGTAEATPRGRVRIRSLFGTTVRELPVAATTVLPGGRTPVAVTWEGVPWFGIYRYDVRVGDGGRDGAGRAARSSGWFVALPPAWVVAIAAAVLGAATWMRRRRRSDERTGWDAGDDPDDGDEGSV